MKKEQVIAIYGSHDASVTFIDKHDRLRVYEYERFVKKRYAMFSSRFDGRTDMGTDEISRRNFLTHIKGNLKEQDIQLVLYAELSQADLGLLKEFFPSTQFSEVGHHYAHACSGFYSAPFKDALIFSVDGGGWDNGNVSMTNIFVGTDGENVTLLDSPRLDFGNPYSGIGYLISEVSPSPEGPESVHALSYAGKIMGLCAYGTVRPEWTKPMEQYYEDGNLQALCNSIGIPYGYNSISEQLSYDLAATSQNVFEQKMWAFIEPYVTKYHVNVVMTGGCGLNVLFNQKLKEVLNLRELDVYVSSNPNDCGLSYGMFLSRFPSLGKKEICYSGLEILDAAEYDDLIVGYELQTFSYARVSKLLKEGKILGVIKGDSEVGPRALGNRSIVCDPSFADMKDTLNAKVKFREWFRPFAPVCLLEDADKYFDRAFESKYMSYAPEVREPYKQQLKAITHVDGTARLQTVCNVSCSFFEFTLLYLKSQQNIPVLLNTSFNIKGKPILTTYRDALYVLDNTELDYLVTDKHIIGKKK